MPAGDTPPSSREDREGVYEKQRRTVEAIDVYRGARQDTRLAESVRLGFAGGDALERR